MQFKSPYFTFDGKSSRDFQLQLCQVGSSDSDRGFGLARTIEKDTSITYSHTIKNISYSDVTLDLTLAKMDKNKLLPITEEEKFEIISWLFQDEFKPFISEDDESKIYYVIFTEGSSYQNALEQGYLKLKLYLNAPCAFSPVETTAFEVVGTHYVDLTHKSNVAKFSEPDFEFQLRGDATSFRVENLATGDVMSFEDLPKGTHIQCYNEGMKQVSCVNDPNLNVRKYMKQTKWIRLVKGVNRLCVSSPSATVAVVKQSRIALS